MIRPRMLAATAVAAVLPLNLALLPPATADPVTVPGGPWPGQENTSAIRSYEQLWKTLESIEGRAHGAFDLSPAPLTSNTGREIPVVTIGDGPTSLMFIANPHGNEYVVSEGMVEVLEARPRAPRRPHRDDRAAGQRRRLRRRRDRPVR